MRSGLEYSPRDISILLFLNVIFIFSINAFGQDSPAGFISIDCGSSGISLDNATQLLWVEDGEYGTPGRNGQVQNATALDYYTYSYYNYAALQTFRYFSEEKMKSRYCYELPLTRSNISFLIRAMFLHGNASELQLPIEFDVYVNASFWMEVNFTDTDDLNLPKVRESIFFAPPEGNVTYVCLVPKQGAPFISSLELRQLDSEGLMYTSSFVDNKELFFTQSVRQNIVAYNPRNQYNYDQAFLRYPNDIYDRLWETQTWTDGTDYGTDISKNWSTIGPNINSVPVKVMESVWLSNNEGPAVLRVDLPGTVTGSFTYGIFYFASNTTTPALQQITLDTTAFPSFTVTSTPSQQSYFHVLNRNQTALIVSSSFVFNALEFYIADSILQQTTDRNHVYVVNFIKDTLNMTTWKGDPCTPTPYDWIGCYLEYKGYSWLVDTLALSHLEDVSGLTLLQSTAWIGENKQTLNYMSITDSNVDSNLFKSLLQTFVEPAWLISLNVSFNNISIFPDSQWWFNSTNATQGLLKSLTSLDLSYNKLTQVPCFSTIPYFSKLQTLNLSSNLISGEFPDTECFSNLSSLKVLIISNNRFEGQIPSSLSIQNLPSLQTLDISNNNFSGQFPSSFYFAKDNNSFESLNADNNEFSGVLDLNQWYNNLENASDLRISLASANNDEVHSQVYSFINNKISSIALDMETFQHQILNLIQIKDFNQTGILLGGNPTCNGRIGFAQRYLCRASFSQIVYADAQRKSEKAIIIGSVLGGALLLFFFILSTVVIWRLSKKVYTLKLVEQELAHRSVQPPYYSYADLKTATQNFHKNNFLGKGSFGEVYKGVLSDESTIAVKRLFNDNKKQVLNEFLNEVVLLTGIKHKNLVQLKGCCIQNEERILVYAYAEKGNVEDALWGVASKRPLSWKERYNICVGVANGLTYLHEELQPGIIHRDVKPANILLDKKLNPKIADFGLAKGFLEDVDEHVTQMICGTQGYFAPEYYAQGRLTTKADVFSFGVVALEIVTGRKSFTRNASSEAIQLIPWALKLQRSGSALKLLDPALELSECCESEVLKLINLALMCVETDPDLRPAMSKIEAMLLENEGGMYDTLCSAFTKRGENNSSMDNIFRSLVGTMQRASPASHSSTSNSSLTGSSTFGSLTPVSEELPLLEA